MNTQKELKNILAISEFIFDNYDDPDYYYNIGLAENYDKLNYVYTRFYWGGEYNLVVVPLSVAREFFKDFEYYQNYESVKDLNSSDLIMIDLNDDYIYNDKDVKEFKNEIKKYSKSLTKE